MRQLIFSSLAILLLFGSCNKAPQSDSYLIFGHFYGECEGEACIEVFKVDHSNSLILEDLRDQPNFDNLKFTILEDVDFGSFAYLLYLIPDELLATSETRIGEPDVTDAGGIYIEYKNEELGIDRSWSIDKRRTMVDSSLHDFMEQIEAAIASLQ